MEFEFANRKFVPHITKGGATVLHEAGSDQKIPYCANCLTDQMVQSVSILQPSGPGKLKCHRCKAEFPVEGFSDGTPF